MFIQDRILENLRDRVYPVNPVVALHGVSDFQNGLKVLNEMVANSLVERVEQKIPGKFGDVKINLYRKRLF